MAEIAAPAPVVVARVDELPPGRTKKFLLHVGGNEVEAFVVNFEGTLRAYVNQCRHVPMTMDWVENQFMTEDGKYLQCATHGAWYCPLSGECVAGPPLGRRLIAVPVHIENGLIVASPPPSGVAPPEPA